MSEVQEVEPRAEDRDGLREKDRTPVLVTKKR